MAANHVDMILETIENRTGIVLKDSRLQRVLSFVEQQTNRGIPTTQILHDLGSKPLNAPCWQEMIQEITVGETYFFRNSGHFRMLREQILPQLIRERIQRNQKYIRIWNAGCATGEEPYSIAMLLHEMIPDIQDWSIFLLASDINETFIQFAKQGVYRERAFRGETPDYIKGRWFHAEDGKYHLDRSIKRMVDFLPMNLIDGDYPSLRNNTSSIDLIMCRNVTIYFDRPTTQHVVNRFYDALARDGWLLVGHSEPQPKVYDKFHMHTYHGAIIYHKPEEEPKPKAYQQDSTNLAELLKDVEVFDEAEIPEPEPQVLATPQGPTLLQEAEEAANREQWEKALNLLQQAEQENRFNPLVHYIRGLVYTHTNQNENAVDAFKQAVYCANDFSLAHYALGELYLKLGNPRQAELSWKRADKSLRHRSPHEPVAGAEDLTVEMLQDLLAYRMR